MIYAREGRKLTRYQEVKLPIILRLHFNGSYLVVDFLVVYLVLHYCISAFSLFLIWLNTSIAVIAYGER